MDESLFKNSILDTFEPIYKNVQDHFIYYEFRNGSESPERTFVLVHGALCTLEFFKVVATELAKVYPHDRIILLDLPWHGKSKSPTVDVNELTINSYAEVAAEFIKTLKVENEIEGKLNWIGWSMGGSIGQLLSLREDVGIDELVLLATSPVWTPVVSLLENVPSYTQPENVKATFYKSLESFLMSNLTDEEREEILQHYDSLTSSPEIMARDLSAIISPHYNVVDQLHSIKIKTLIVGGKSDYLADGVSQQTLKDKIPNSNALSFDDNHMLLVKPTFVKEMVKEMKRYFD